MIQMPGREIIAGIKLACEKFNDVLYIAGGEITTVIKVAFKAIILLRNMDG